MVHKHANRPRNKCTYVCSSIMWFILNLQMRKMYSINTLLYNIYSIKMCASKLQKAFLERWPFMKGSELPSPTVLSCKSTTHFLSHWPPPPSLSSLDSPLLIPHPPHTCDPNFYCRMRHWHIGILLGPIHSPDDVDFLR
jgi:hypothetical protein